MKKRCTNSSCRKVFSVNSFSVSCPYCGKAYPRMLALYIQRKSAEKHTAPRLSAFVTLEELNLSVRSHNCLKRAGFQNAADIFLAGAGELRRIRGLGQSSFKEIIRVLALMGYDCAFLREETGDRDDSAFSVGSVPVPQSVSADYRDKIILRSGKCVSAAPLCVNGVYLPMGNLFKRFDEILCEGSPNRKKLEMIKALRDEFRLLTGNRMILALRSCKDLVEQYLSCGLFPAVIEGNEEYSSCNQGVTVRMNHAYGCCQSPALSQLGKPGRRTEP